MGGNHRCLVSACEPHLAVNRDCINIMEHVQFV